MRVSTADRDYTKQDKPDGDFFRLLNEVDEQTKSKLFALRGKLSRRAAEEPTAPSSEPDIWRRINNAFKALTTNS